MTVKSYGVKTLCAALFDTRNA